MKYERQYEADRLMQAISAVCTTCTDRCPGPENCAIVTATRVLPFVMQSVGSYLEVDRIYEIHRASGSAHG
jgi:hypothetical protein